MLDQLPLTQHETKDNKHWTH